MTGTGRQGPTCRDLADGCRRLSGPDLVLLAAPTGTVETPTLCRTRSLTSSVSPACRRSACMISPHSRPHSRPHSLYKPEWIPKSDTYSLVMPPMHDEAASRVTAIVDDP
jgi:hypothetical protein